MDTFWEVDYMGGVVNTRRDTRYNIVGAEPAEVVN